MFRLDQDVRVLLLGASGVKVFRYNSGLSLLRVLSKGRVGVLGHSIRRRYGHYVLFQQGRGRSIREQNVNRNDDQHRNVCKV